MSPPSAAMVILLASSCCAVGDFRRPPKKIYFGGFFPITDNDQFKGQGIMTASDLAVRHINESPDILPDYELNMLWNDTKASADIMYNMYRPEISIICIPYYVHVHNDRPKRSLIDIERHTCLPVQSRSGP